MSAAEYVRKLAYERGSIEMRDVRPGDVIMLRKPGEVPLKPRTVATVLRSNRIVYLTYTDGHASSHDWRAQASLAPNA